MIYMDALRSYTSVTCISVDKPITKYQLASLEVGFKNRLGNN